jgi:FKBP-type peptidyl-prolyl cis-trans isomerase SlyD
MTFALGERVYAEGPNGPNSFTIMELTDTGAVLDGNHPLAGQTLHFDVEVLEIRPASKEELTHGHVHDVGGHHHNH